MAGDPPAGGTTVPDGGDPRALADAAGAAEAGPMRSYPEFVKGSVVVGVDGSGSARAALAWAADHAARTRRPLVLVHAVAPTGALTGTWLDQAGIDHAELAAAVEEEVASLLGEAATAATAQHAGLVVHPLRVDGDARGVLHDLGSAGADVLVVGSRGHGPVASLLLGSVSAGVARHATAPVVVVRGHREPGPSSASATSGGIVVGVDATPASRAAAAFALELAEEHRWPVTAVHCFFDIEHAELGHAFVPDDDPSFDDARSAAAETLAGLAAEHPDVPVRLRLARGPADEMVVRAATGLDLVVVGAERRGPIGTALFGSVAGSVLEHAPCTVAVVPVPTAP